MVFPLSNLPGYPEEAKTTATAKPGRVVIATESSRRSTQAYVTRVNARSSLGQCPHQNDRGQIGVSAEEQHQRLRLWISEADVVL